jgi:hypothetical protein
MIIQNGHYKLDTLAAAQGTINHRLLYVQLEHDWAVTVAYVGENSQWEIASYNVPMRIAAKSNQQMTIRDVDDLPESVIKLLENDGQLQPIGRTDRRKHVQHTQVERRACTLELVEV